MKIRTLKKYPTSMKSKKRVYINAKQAAFLQAKPKRKCFQGGRGSGKSSVKGFKDHQRMKYLPRAKFMLAGLTYNHILTKTLPSAEESWRACGLREYDKAKKAGHYVICQKPPDSFLKPYQPPRNYDNVITFFNGYTLEMVSLDRPDSNRGGNFDGLDLDESALVKEDVFNKVLQPMVRGNIYRFNHPFFQEICDYSSAAWLPSGQWIYKTEELMLAEPENYFFIQSTSLDNIAVLGPDYAKKLKATMSKLEFDVEVLNRRIKKLPNCFYPALTEDRHVRAFTFSYEFNAAGILVPKLNDIVDDEPLETSWDFNAAIVSLLVCQEVGQEFRCLNALFRKPSDIDTDNPLNPTLIDATVELFLETYKNHACKHVKIYGDRNGNNKSPGMTRTFYETIVEKFQKGGWSCEIMAKGLDSEHRLRHVVINELLGETNPRMPKVRMNQTNCKFLFISMQNSPMTDDFKKDKKSEKLLIDQENATHLSDTFDNIIMAKYGHLMDFDQGDDRVYFLSA